MTRDTPNNGGEGQNPTASGQSTPSATITIGPDATDTHRRPNLSHGEFQGLAIFSTHGVADSASTLFATHALDASAEANPFIAQLLQQGWGWAAGTMLLVAGLVAIVYPSIADLDTIPKWFGTTLAAIGLLIAIVNVIVGVTA